MKNMKNKLFGMILFSALCSFSAQAATTVSILSKSGESSSYSVSETGKLYFEGDKLMITEKSGAKSVAVDVSTIRKVTFKSGSVGVEGQASDAIAFAAFPNPVKDVVFLAGVNGGENVSVYNANGALVGEYTYAEEGINLSSLPSGAYVISVSGKSVKISKL